MNKDPVELMKKAMHDFNISTILAFSSLVDLILMASSVPMLKEYASYTTGLIILGMFALSCAILFGIAIYLDSVSDKLSDKSGF